MAWIAKDKFSFNLYYAGNGKVTRSISEAKKFKTKKEAIEETKTFKADFEILKIEKKL